MLAVEAARDAFRRRFALALAILLVPSLAWVNTCTGLGSDVSFNDQVLDPAVVAGFLAPILFSLQAMVVLWAAGVLASDQLARPLAEGSAALWLARPVSRDAWASARLAGALAVALAGGALLLGGTAALLARRYGVALGPAAVGALATALGATVVAALAAALSLALGRTPILLALAIGVPLQFFADAAGLVVALAAPGTPLPGMLDALHRFGPPLGTAVFAAAAAWNPHVVVEGAVAPAFGRLALWTGGALALLLFAARRIEIGR